jgi:hypothetical protein
VSAQLQKPGDISMIAALICVVLLAALAQFVYYCRSALASASEVELSDHVLEVTGMQSGSLVAGDFRRFLQLVRLCPEHAADRREIRAVESYYNLIHTIEHLSRKLIPSVSLWAEGERRSCSRFAAVVLDRSISSSRDLFTQHVPNNP